jgi:hypothetical protein
MIARTKTLALATALAGGAMLAASPASAQDKGGDRVNMVIAYSEDECPDAQEGEIVVCEILVEADRYRIPRNLRSSDSPQNVARDRQIERIRYAGAFGIMSCDPAGAGGELGCTQQMIDAAYADKEEGSRVRFAQLIEEARQQRLSTIDIDAAAEQERVEAIEREYLERLEKERNAPLPGEVDPTLTPPDALDEPRIIPVPPSKPGPVIDPDGEEQVDLDAAPPPQN